ncbi:MAG: ribonuclease P protein component [Elusimicrobia bacterium RIFCSPHIGHO2_02_FULL_57_9]|nr:MAG: ribonuclease P protein component [Elusimicrobia bacterium RIFCSPHIGHO2_02_FULL_57_9]
MPEVRLSSRGDFKKVFAEGKKIVGRNAILWFRSGPSAKTRLGLSVSVKTGGAVRRNRLKRLAREAFRLNRENLKSGQDMVIYLRPGCSWLNFKDAEKEVIELCRKAGLRH